MKNKKNNNIIIEWVNNECYRYSVHTRHFCANVNDFALLTMSGWFCSAFLPPEKTQTKKPFWHCFNASIKVYDSGKCARTLITGSTLVFQSILIANWCVCMCVCVDCFVCHLWCIVNDLSSDFRFTVIFIETDVPTHDADKFKTVQSPNC